MDSQPKTMLSDLPELSDIESGIGVGQPQTYVMENIIPTSGIRQTQGLHPDSGMTSSGSIVDYGYNNQNVPQGMIRDDGVVHGHKHPHLDPLHDISCLNIAQHIQSCPICSKFYNNDKTAHTIAIVILAIVCILLLKRVLDV